VLEDAPAAHFHLLDEVLNVPLHGMPVRCDGVKRDPVLAAPRFEIVRFKFSCTVAAYGLGILPVKLDGAGKSAGHQSREDSRASERRARHSR
jgi:hypothetical protein